MRLTEIVERMLSERDVGGFPPPIAIDGQGYMRVAGHSCCGEIDRPVAGQLVYGSGPLRPSRSQGSRRGMDKTSIACVQQENDGAGIMSTFDTTKRS